MKKVLIIANLFHASPRIPGISKYLADFNWEPTIISVPIREDPRGLLSFPNGFRKNVKIIQTSHVKDVFSFFRKILELFGFEKKKSFLNQIKVKSKNSLIDKLFKLYSTIFAYPDEIKKWKKPLFKTCCKVLEREKFDAIISSSSPVTCHVVANKLKKKYGLMWVADFRDPWTQNHNYSYPWWRKMFEKKLELRTLKNADALITVSEPDVRNLMLFHKKRAYTITNGFDPEKVNNLANQLTNKFTITYTGKIYEKQYPAKVLIALQKLILEDQINPNDLEFRFYGPNNISLENKIKEYKLSSIVKQYGNISRDLALEKQRESQVLVKFNWEDLNQKGCYTGKIFEYLAAKRPIIATGGFAGDVTENLLKLTKAGIFATSTEEIEKCLLDFYKEYKEKGKVDYDGKLEEVNKYSYREKAGDFAKILNEITCN